MKRIISLLTVMALMLSLAACKRGEENEDVASSEISSVTSSEESVATGSAEDSDDEDVVVSSEASSTVGTVSSLEDFGDKLEENGFETEVKENDDGSITIGLKPTTPSEDDDKNKPVIPTLPSVDDIDEEDQPEILEETPSSSETSGSSDNTQKQFYTYTTNQTHTAKKNTESYLYSILTAEQKEWYRKIDAAVNNLETEVFLDVDLLTNENYNIYFLYLIDNPEHFYLSNVFGIYNFSNKPNNHGIKLYYAVGTQEGQFSDNEHEFTDTLKNNIKSKKAKFEAKVNEFISTIPAAAPAVEKEKLIYDKILVNSVYNMDAALNHPTQGMADDWTAYGVLVNGTGVCESYDEAFQYLLRRVGIRSTGIVGKVTVDPGQGPAAHKWCEVEIEGGWYMCDITFDDPVGGAANAAYHRYFNLTSGEMASKDKHDWSANDYKLPDCTATEYSYDNYFKK